MKTVFGLVIFVTLLASLACSPRKSETEATAPPSAASPPSPPATLAQRMPARSRVELPRIVQPSMPAVIPGYTQLDPDTGLHMTGGPLLVDLESYRLEVKGRVARPFSLDYDELRMLPGLRSRATIICRGYFEDTAIWEGASLAEIMEKAGVSSSARYLKLVGADGYEATVTIEEARKDDNFLAYALEDRPLPVLHGFPLRAVFPSLLGNKWVKWLVRIEAE